MSLADPLEVPETEVMVSLLESTQSQISAARTLVAFLRGRRFEGNYALVEEQLNNAEAHLRSCQNDACSGHPTQIRDFTNDPLDCSLALRRTAGTTEARSLYHSA